jgi:glutaredoxin
MNPQQVTGVGDKKHGLTEQTAALDMLTFDVGAKKGLDANRLQACVKAQSDKTVQESVKEAEAIGVTATPTIFINGRKLEGAVDADDFRASLNDALRDAGQPVPPPPPKPVVNIVPMPQAIPPVPTAAPVPNPPAKK